MSAASQTLGLQTILDWGWKFNVYVWMDARADWKPVFLWVQTMVTGGKISLGKKRTNVLIRFVVSIR